MKRISIPKRRAIVFLIIPIVLLMYDIFATVRLTFHLTVPLSPNGANATRNLEQHAGRRRQQFPISAQVDSNVILSSSWSAPWEPAAKAADKVDPCKNSSQKEATTDLHHSRTANIRPSHGSPSPSLRSEGHTERNDTYIDPQTASKSLPRDIPRPLQDNDFRNCTPSRALPDVLIVVVAIPDGYPGKARVAAASHRAYARRHGYRLHLETHSESGDIRTASLQKLLACRRARKTEKYVLILDYDVVIAPWAPCIPNIPAGKIGIVDEAQPSPDHITRILLLRAGNSRTPGSYYRSLGFPLSEDITPRGILNTGVLLVQPAAHCKLLESLYDKHVDIQKTHGGRFHYEQAMLGQQFLQRGMVHPMHHAWNRIWVWYNWSEPVGLEKYEVGGVFRRSYFLHFCWAKDVMPKLERWMNTHNISFEIEYPIQHDPLP